MRRPDPHPPFPFWPEGRYRPIPTEAWLSGTGEMAAFLTEIEREGFDFELPPEDYDA